MNVRWWGPGPWRSRKRRRKGLSSGCQGWRISTRAAVGEPELGGPEADVEASRAPLARRARRRTGARRRTSARRPRPRGRATAPAMVGGIGPGCRAPRSALSISVARRAGGRRAVRACYAVGHGLPTRGLSPPWPPTCGPARRRARTLVTHALERIEALNPQVNAFVAVDADGALEAAARIDDAVAAGEDPGPLAGIPIGVKDLEDAAGFVTSQGSAVFAGGAAAVADSPLVARLRAAGCVVVGKTNTPELGWKADTDNAMFGPTCNPWNLAHSPGGSSGGSAAAIASGMVPLATGSDGGGSIRIPSSCCGLSGVKPSLGRVPSGGDARLGLARPVDEGAHGAARRRCGDRPRRRRGSRSHRHPLASETRGVVAGRPRRAPSCPPRWRGRPTLGYAPLDDEVRALCEDAVGRLESLGYRGGRDRGRVRRGSRARLVDAGHRLQLADPGALPRTPSRGKRSTLCWPRRWTGPPSTCRLSTSCGRRTPCHRHEPPPGGALPRRPAAPDARPARVRRRRAPSRARASSTASSMPTGRASPIRST